MFEKFDKLTEENYILYAMRCYDNPNCHNVNEFKEDLNRVKYIKRLLNRYIRKGNLKDRLLLNHIIIFCNTFGNEAAVRMLFFKLNRELYPALKTFFVFLNIMPEVLHYIGDRTIYSSDILVDNTVAKILRAI
jgi:hypothetical protein